MDMRVILVAGLLLTLAPGALLAQPAPAHSGVFVARDGNTSVIVISGRISTETETAFAAALRAASAGNGQARPRIYLSSPGGSLTPGLNMGRMIREARLETFVPAGAGCWSACGLIWLAGTERHLDPAGRVGFHAAFVPQQGGPGQISGSGNAVIGAYLSRLGYNDNAIRFFTSARPDQMFELKPAQFQDYGITVQRTAARQPSPPEQAPGASSPRLAGIWTGQYQCGKDVVGARMAVREDGPQRFAAKFDFGPTPGAPSLPRGSFAIDRKSTRLNSSHSTLSRMPSSA